ncbi:MAG: molybdenum cofactor guanylyltransferase [Phycisphaerales bacterium JB039]
MPDAAGPDAGGSGPAGLDPAQVQPVVLVGGRSRRFGRDKLREPVAGGWLVDRPIAALRAIFGPRVACVGECDPQVAARFDLVIPDLHPGAGPIGGIISALAHAQAPVFILAGDLASITADEVRALLTEWGATPPCRAPARRAGWGRIGSCREQSPAAPLAIMAGADRPEPCCAIYLPGALPILAARLEAGRRSLHDALDPGRVILVRLDPSRLRNINAQEDLGG